MNPKIMKLRGELEKNKGKISDLQGRNRELEKQIRELEEKKQDYYTSYQNMGFTMIVGIGLLFGCVCALILSNYLRHG